LFLAQLASQALLLGYATLLFFLQHADTCRLRLLPRPLCLGNRCSLCRLPLLDLKGRVLSKSKVLKGYEPKRMKVNI
jgi:hypothetical protein